MRAWRARRRRRLRARPFPRTWAEILEAGVPLYGRLPTGDRGELHGHIHVLLAEKRFEGASDLTITEPIEVVICGQACILLLHRETDYFPGLESIIVYPGEYRAETERTDELGVVTEGVQTRLGESWSRGAVVLSWRDVLLAAKPGHGNVVLHEFAHQLDVGEGRPILPDRRAITRWEEVMAREHAALVARTAAGRPTTLDPYGAENRKEFFAVLVEAFFLDPHGLKRQHPQIYGLLMAYFRQDPTAWTQADLEA